jgi:glycosyltransferase involved in cell wall biosynthesis
MKSKASRKAPVAVFINRVYPPQRGATGSLLRELTRSMAEKGWKVTVVTSAPEARLQKDGKVEIIRVGAPASARSAIGTLKIWWRLFREGLKQPAPDLLVTMTDPPMLIIAGNILSRIKKSAHIHWCQDLYPDLLPVIGVKLPKMLQKILSLLATRALRKADRIIVIGRCMARKISEKGVDTRRISMIPNWPDEELEDSTLRATWKRKKIRKVKVARNFKDLFRDDEPKFRILYAGNLGRAHPVGTILEAAGMLAGDYPEIEFVFVGDGPGQDRLAQERAKRQLNNIRLLPYQPADRLRQVLESGDVHIVSMRHEAAGMLVPCKIYSALAAKRPVIFVGPVHCEAARIINDYHAGAVIPQGQAALLAEAIRHYREDANLWFEAREGAIEAGRLFVPEQSISAWTERAEDAVERKKIE